MDEKLSILDEPAQGSERGDETMAKSIELSEEANQQIFRMILENSYDSVHYSLDLNTNSFGYISPSATAILGYSSAEIENFGIAGFQEYIHPEDRARLTEDFEQNCRYQHIVPQIEYRFQHKDGSYKWLRERRSIICDNNRVPMVITGTITDITPEKRLAGKLENLCDKFSLSSTKNR